MKKEKPKCKAKVRGEGKFGSMFPTQCSFKQWKDGFCKIHHPESIAIRRKKSDEKWEEKRKNDPLIKAWNKIREQEKTIKILERENKNLKKQVLTLQSRTIKRRKS